MFETRVDVGGTFDGRTLAGYVSQMFVAATIPFAWALVTRDEVGMWGIGFFLGTAVHKVFPRAARTGRWVWALPMFMWLVFFIGDLIHFSFAHVVTEFFFGTGEDGWGAILATLPTCSCILYSAAMALAAAHLRRKDTPHRAHGVRHSSEHLDSPL
jgi:hypothetical protein